MNPLHSENVEFRRQESEFRILALAFCLLTPVFCLLTPVFFPKTAENTISGTLNQAPPPAARNPFVPAIRIAQFSARDAGGNLSKCVDDPPAPPSLPEEEETRRPIL
jgi:hypothetical protein